MFLMMLRSMTLEEAKNLMWGTFGEGAIEDYAIDGKPLPPMQKKRLGDMDDMHLKNIYCNQKHISDYYRKAIRLVLKDRSANWLLIEDQRSSIRRREAVAATKAKKSS